MDAEAVPLHLQQLGLIAAALQESQQHSDSVSWVPQTIPTFVQSAVQKALSARHKEAQVGVENCLDGTAQRAHHLTGSGLHGTEVQAAETSQTTATQGAQEADAGCVIIVGSQQVKAAATKSSSTSWVATVCLVPEGLPTAAAADLGGGLACCQVACRVLGLQDCAPAAPSPGITTALSKVKWHQFGLAFKAFTPGTTDTSGILTLDVMPHAVAVPLSMVVCSTNTFSAIADPAVTAEATADVSATEAAPQHSLGATATATAAAAAGTITRRGKGSGNYKLPQLSCKREAALFVTAFEDALLALKARLPPGYMQGKLEACIASCLPPISVSLASILTQAANPVLCQQACELLSCDAQQLRQTLLLKLQTAASKTLAAKSSVGSGARQLERQQQQQQQKRGGGARKGNRATAAVAAAAALAAAAGHGLRADTSTEGSDDPQQQQSGAWILQRQQTSSPGHASMSNVQDELLQQQQQQTGPNNATDKEWLAQQPDWLHVEPPALTHHQSITAATELAQLDWFGGAVFDTDNVVKVSEGACWHDQSGPVSARDDNWDRKSLLDCTLSQPTSQPRAEQPWPPRWLHSAHGTLADGLFLQKPAAVQQQQQTQPQAVLGAAGTRYQLATEAVNAETPSNTAPCCSVRSAQRTVSTASALLGSLCQDLPVFAPTDCRSAQITTMPDVVATAQAAAEKGGTSVVSRHAGWHMKQPLQTPRRRVSGSAAASLF